MQEWEKKEVRGRKEREGEMSFNSRQRMMFFGTVKMPKEWEKWGPVVRSRHLLNANHTVSLWLFPLCLLHNGEKGSWDDKWWRDDMKNYRFCWQLRNENVFNMGAQLLMDTWWLCWIEWFSRCLHLWCMASWSKKTFKSESSCSALRLIHSKAFVN